jgi:hypothetical protein
MVSSMQSTTWTDGPMEKTIGEPWQPWWLTIF